ncbi:4-hydroxy-tetrahydrodipicolinate synthase [Sphingomonas sp. LY160]|uniref:4-hydroxy-tetrahydrodipicolinate synthase n=1 Tax=Sphingomonas sp. LY160 TaxID=3095342 RepID=UPI002ADEE6D5|nr:4-hydroxy-tetrahydrodipicolinate synthase [Sphingomonas sp. LY160]MEA1071320.1 4-hydroxy-tetrahydrodipicolinate synthase [Sphingomonas sp. LY160]
MFFGSIPALVTPFAAGRVDEAATRVFIEWQIDEGSNALVPCGTTGEAATLSPEEHRRMIEIAVEVSRGRVPVIAGCGANDTRHAIALTRAAKEAGADAALHVPPYYNRPNQDGIYAHLSAVADEGIPIVLYNVPARTVTDISVETMARLSRLPNVVGVKDATGNLARVSAQREACGAEFVQLSGNDDMALGFSAMGGKGCISVTANVAPKLCAQFQEATREGRWDEALQLQDRLFPLHTAMFTDASPGPVKYALSKVRPDFPTELRLPMTEPSAASKAAVDAALVHAGLI